MFINTPNDFKTTEEAEENLRTFAKDLDSENYKIHIYNDTSVEKGILNFAKKLNAGLLGIGTHGRKGIAHFFNGSISEDLVNHANRPVLTFKI